MMSSDLSLIQVIVLICSLLATTALVFVFLIAPLISKGTDPDTCDSIFSPVSNVFKERWYPKKYKWFPKIARYVLLGFIISSILFYFIL